MGPGITGLRMKVPIVGGNVVRVQNSISALERITPRKVTADELSVDSAVHNNMGNMNIFVA